MKPKTAKASRTTATKSLRKAGVATKTVPFDVAHHLRTPAAQVAYLNAWLEESPEDVAGIARAFGDVVRARGMTKVANETGLSRESLYKAFSDKGNPKLATVLAVANAIDLTIRVELPTARARKRQLTTA